MDRQIDRWIDGQMDKYKDGQIDRYLYYRQMDRPTSRPKINDR